ncbi:MAG: hypothetical protein HYY48_10585 [Gammaproteobacteria bacterium]|nr:hypothetical protein [Gammaproteobacteria bacterium]
MPIRSLCLAIILAAAAAAQEPDAAAPDKAAPEEPAPADAARAEPEPRQAATGGGPAQPPAETDEVPEAFKPSEELSEDLSVPFPVDM